MKARGLAALGTIVVIGSLLLAMVLIMASISIIPLRMANQHLLSMQARMVGLAALEQVRFDYLTAAEAAVQGANGLDFSNPPAPPLNLANRYNFNPVFTVSGQMDNRLINITFDSSKSNYFSKDNLISELPAAGCEDIGTSNTSVPAFSADMVINVQNQGGPFHYDAVLSQVWDYAVFSLSGMTLDQNTTVEGNVGITAIDPVMLAKGSGVNQAINIGSGGTDSSIPVSTLVDGNADILFAREQVIAAMNSGTSLPSLVNVLPGGQLTGTEVHDLVPVSSALSSATTGGLNIIFPNPASFTSATFTVVPEDAMRAWQDFTADGANITSLSVPNPVLPPLLFATNVQDPSSLVPVPPVPVPVNSSASSMNYIPDTVTLDGSTGPSKYYVNSDVTNYRPTFTVTKTRDRSGHVTKTVTKTNDPDLWDYSGAGLNLKDCCLFVNGNLDLVQGPPAKPGQPATPSLSIYGDNATIIVSGSLRLEQGQLQASDRGLVIMADAISLESGGTYKGLIVARQELRIVPMAANNTLSVNGSIFAKGSNLEEIQQQQQCGPPIQVTVVNLVDNPLQVSSTGVTYNPRYVKGLNSLGVLTLKTWRLLP